MRLERWITLVALVATALPAPAKPTSPIDSERGTVNIRIERRTELHEASEDLRRLCRASWEVDGCTDFPVETLEPECERRGGAWGINVSANLQAVTHLRHSSEQARLMVHEARHVGDLEENLREHLDTLATMRFESAISCQGYARFLRESPHLRVVMNRLRVESNAKFGCSRGRK